MAKGIVIFGDGSRLEFEASAEILARQIIEVAPPEPPRVWLAPPNLKPDLVRTNVLAIRCGSENGTPVFRQIR